MLGETPGHLASEVFVNMDAVDRRRISPGTESVSCAKENLTSCAQVCPTRDARGLLRRARPGGCGHYQYWQRVRKARLWMQTVVRQLQQALLRDVQDSWRPQKGDSRAAACTRPGGPSWRMVLNGAADGQTLGPA